MMARLPHNPHPGEILRDEFLVPLALTQNQLAIAIQVPSNRINDIVRGRRGITPDTDLRLCHAFKLSQGFWLRLQLNYDLMEAKRHSKDILKSIKPINSNSLNAA
jgi:addiction module HigA family antidote